MRIEYNPYGYGKKHFAGVVDGKEIIVSEWEDHHDGDKCVALKWGDYKISQDEFSSWDYKEIAILAVALQVDPYQVIAEWPDIKAKRDREEKRKRIDKEERTQKVVQKIKDFLSSEEWELIAGYHPFRK